ncbi:MAG: hypothetical protein JNM00_13025 [Flavobacteriales bacterium]|nr:hypothetical protein [Flavobacteriales bacterium]
MKNKQHHFYIMVLAFSLALWSCKKEDEQPVAPVIEYLSLSSTQVVQFEETLQITFSYEDEQGDLGEPDPDTYSLSVKDARLENADWYHLPPMTPELQPLHIKGTFTVEIPPLFLLGNGQQETTTFKLQITDRAGNKSNEIITPEVLIVDSL